MIKQTFKNWQSSLALIVIAIVFSLGASVSAFAQNSAKSPVLKDKLISVLQKKALTDAQIIEVIQSNGVNFELTGEVESELRKAGASEAVVKAIRESSRIDKKDEDSRQALTAGDTAQPSQVDILFKQGVDYYNAGDDKKAIKTWEQAAKIDPARQKTFFNLGASYYNTKQYSKSIAAFQEALRLKPDDSQTKQSLSMAEAAEKERKEKRRAMWSGVLGAISEAVKDDDNKSQNTQTQSGGGGNTAPANLGGTKVQGNYTFSNGYNVFRRFVFSSDGTFKRGGAASGTTTNGTTYVGASTDTGKYSINGGTLTLYTDDGKTETHTIDIRGEGLSPLYLVIDGQTFTNRD